MYSIGRLGLRAMFFSSLIVSPLAPAVNAQDERDHARRDWPSFLGVNRDGRSTETGIDPEDLKAGLPLLWQVNCELGYATCSVADGRCYLFDAVEGTARLRCLDAETGKQLWVYTYDCIYEDLYGYDAGPRASPVVDVGATPSESTVFIYGVEGQLHAINAGTGRRVWTIDMMERFGCIQNFFGVGSTPLLHKDYVLIMVGGSPPDSAEAPPGRLDLVEPNGSAVVAIHKKTGELVYETGHDLASYASIVTRRSDDRDWGFAFARSGLLAFDPNSGTIDFMFPWRAKKLESVNASTPVVVKNRLLVSESYEPGCALLEFGVDREPQVIWKDSSPRDQIMACHWCTPVFDKGFIYGCHGQHRSTAELRCVRWEDGEVMWSHPGLSRSSLIYVDKHLVCLTEEGELLLIDANPARFQLVGRLSLKLDDGKLSSATELLDHPAWAAPVLAQGRLYLRGKGRLICARLMPPSSH